MKATPGKTLQYLGDDHTPKPRCIVAGIFLSDGHLVFIDRNNGTLLITDPDQETIQEFNLLQFVPDKYIKAPVVADKGKGAENHGASVVPPGKWKTEGVRPSDVNHGFAEDQLLVSYTSKYKSLGIVFQLENRRRAFELRDLFIIEIPDRTRSLVVLDKDHVCATVQFKILVVDKTGQTVAEHKRNSRDRGGLLMRDENGRFFYGDGDDFVCCHWDGEHITEMFRFWNKRMLMPRGSTITPSGSIIVCCDPSHTIFDISSDGSQSEVIVYDKEISFGDVDFHPSKSLFVTTYWSDNMWPVLYTLHQ